MTVLISRRQLLESLRGQSIQIPDLQDVLRDWPRSINPGIERLRDDVEKKLESLLPGDRRLAKLKAADFGLFGASWWPNADYAQLRTVTYLAIWLFIWDDEIDAEIGPLSGSMEQARIFRTETIEHIRQCLGLDSQKSYYPHENPIIDSFNVVGQELRRAYSKEQRQTLMTEISFFMQTSEVEQRVRLSQYTPSVEEYSHCRMGTSAVGVCLAINEYAGNSQGISSVMHDTEMTNLWNQVNMIVWVINDLLSLKKEIAQDTVDSLIPLLYAAHGSAQAAIEKATVLLRSAVLEFEKSSQKILDKYKQDPTVAASLKDFIDICRLNCTGNLHWSLCTQRYGISQKFLDGGIRIML